MPRIRSIKPEFWNDPKLALACSRDARLLFISLWNFADDKGRTKAHPAVVKAQAFPFEDVTRDQVAGWLTELEVGRFIRRYDVEGEQYLDIRTFRTHQRIDKPQKSGYCPEPPKDLWKEQDESKSGRRTVVEPSSNRRRTVDESFKMDQESDQDQDQESETDQHLSAEKPAAGAGGDSVSSTAPPEASPPRPELKLEQPEPPKRRKRKPAGSAPSEWALLTDELVGYRATVPPFECDWDDSFDEKVGKSVAAVQTAVEHLAKKHDLEPPRAKALLLQAGRLYLREDWFGRMDRNPPWSLWVLLKHEHLDRFAEKALELTWHVDDGTGRWEPATDPPR